MDDRRRQIDSLEKKKRDNAVLLDGLLIRLGEGFFQRIPDSAKEDNSSPAELADYLRLQNEIAGSEASIEVIEDHLKKLKELEENIAGREKEDKAFSKELSGMYGGLGKLLLDSPPPVDGEDFCAPYRSQAEELFTKVQSLEERLSGLGKKEGGNVLTWLGNGAQSLVLRSFLTRALENLDSLRRNAGERYSRRDTGTGSVSVETGELCLGIEKKRAEAKAVSQELAALREERREMSAGLNAEGNPIKQIQFLKKHIAGIREELKTLYRRAGAEAAGIGSTAAGASRLRQFVDPLIIPDDGETLDNAAKIDQSMQNDDKLIGRLRASLAIDEERAKIEKYHRMIQEKKEKIAQAEKNIADFEEGIADSESYIKKMQELL